MKSFSILICMMFSLNIHANNYSISGRIFDAVNQQVLPFANIALFDNNTEKLISGTVAGDDGRFSLHVNSTGNYKIAISFVGYKNFFREILIGGLNQNYDLGKIILEPLSENIDEVTIKAQKQILSSTMEKKTFDMSDNIANTGGSVLDAMKTMPGVTVDQEGKVVLRGSDKVIVLIDGKQSSLTGFGNQKGLDNIPVANIEKIEIINNPSAKYDASGMAGIINIIYKKEKENGLNGDIGFNYGIGAVTKPKADLPTELGSYQANPKYMPSFNLNYRKDKINFFLQSESMYLNKLPNNEFTTRFYDDGRITASQVPENRTQKHYILKGGADYFLNENNTFTVSAIYDWERHIDTAQVPYIDMKTEQRYRYITWREEEITGYMNYAAQFKHKFSQPGHELDFTAQYTRGWEDETYHLNDSSNIRQGEDLTSILATEHTTFVQADYVKPLSNGRLELGTKFQVRKLPVDFVVERGENSIVYSGLGEWSKWGENIYAGYANYVYENKKYDIEAGLRGEFTNVFYRFDSKNAYYPENDKYNYLELFPNVRLSYKFNLKNKVSVFYNRRVDRPGEPELRIFAKSDDQELLKIGNPYLRPQFTQSFETAFQSKWSSGAFYIAGYYRIIDNPFMRIYTVDNNNTLYDVIVKTYANTGSSKNKGVEIIFSQQIMDFWKISANTNIYKNNIDAYEGKLFFPYEHTFTINNSSENTWDGKLSNQFLVTDEFSVQLTGIYMAPKNIPQGKELSRASVDFGIKMKILKGKGELNLSATDIFNTYAIRQEIKGEVFTADYENYYETQVFNLGLKYKF